MIFEFIQSAKGAIAMAPVSIPGWEERARKPDMFRKPVTILVGLGSPPKFAASWTLTDTLLSGRHRSATRHTRLP
ncbi:hypothetical protein ASG68_29525 [Rhizobium sp. Leaf453]|nr:hypothetical protein ASG42_30095 [Rhizobium sp. Leaf391]KQU00878.1 hypothetical protein ASG68_29525 [Rhizobium sp. Leaf453]